MKNKNFRYAKFLSTPSVRRATGVFYLRVRVNDISIHALRAEGDEKEDKPVENPLQFLSTPSVRRATPFTSLRRPDI